MTERDQPIPPGHTPQHRPEQEPRPDPTPEQDEGHSTEFLKQLAGSHTDGTAYIDAEDVDRLEGISMTDVYEGDTDVNQELVEGEAERFDLLVERELREGETDDVMEAVEEGLTYVPPIDPPITFDHDNPESIAVATGTDISARDPQFAESGLDTAHMGDDDMEALVRRSLRDDSATSHLADRLSLAVINGLVIIRGEIDDIDDSDNIIGVVSDIPGVQEVRDQTVVRGL
ncbi:MAG TPA: BON domain-containing protein [Herpetosiphonaceae bacterium]